MPVLKSFLVGISPLSIAGLTLVPILLVPVGILSILLYNLVLHSLRRYPGPLFARASSFLYHYHEWVGDAPFWIHKQHQKYGHTVRIGPNRLSYTDSRAWKQIYGFQKLHVRQLQKDPNFYMQPGNGVPGMLSALDDEYHAKIRRIFTPAFSERALREQESMLSGHIALLLEKLKADAKSNTPVDMARWLNYTTLDIMSDLTFGEPLGLLRDLSNAETIPWVTMIYGSLKILSIMRLLKQIPGVNTLVSVLVPKDLKKKRLYLFEFASQCVKQRLASSTTRPDIWTLVLNNADQGNGLNIQEMNSNASLFMSAGTETTATGLSGLLYCLATNPDKMRKLTAEVRGEFLSEADITTDKLAKQKYLNACIEEGLRVHMPLPVGLPRVVPREGAEICDKWVAPGTIVAVSQLATYRSESNFRNALSFIPERWLGDSAYANDDRNALQPFSYGPRNCIGKNLAYHEMRLILTTLLWHFDFKLTPQSSNWIDQKIWDLWKKNPLVMELEPVR